MDLAVDGVFPKGRYIVERQNAGVFLNRFPEVEIDRGITVYHPLRDRVGNDLNGKRILIVRPAGFGDLLFITPVFRQLKIIAPGCLIVVACLKNYAGALMHNADVDEIVPYPVPMEEWTKADYHLWLERILEDDPITRKVNAVDVIASAAGVVLEDKTMRYEITPDETEETEKRFPRNDKPRIGIQVQASAKNRSYPFDALMKVGNDLLEEGCEVYLFASPGTVKADKEFVNLSERKLTFRQSAAVLKTCDVMITPDSALCHIAGALDVPTIALFGPFPSQIRTAYQKSVFAIDGHAPCAPCHHHDNTWLDWPDGCPGWKNNKCSALANIDPRRVVREALKRIPPRNIALMP